MPQLFTIGHSTRAIDEFIELLRAHGVVQVVDIRTVPRSAHNPQFGKTRLARSLKRVGIKYVHLATLGGLRHTKKDSVNLGWRNASFRGYADYMATPEFRAGLVELMRIAKSQAKEGHAKEKETAIMCAEAVPWRCHRSLVADALTKTGVFTKQKWIVQHIQSRKTAKKHKLTPFLEIRKGELVYPAID